MIGARQRCPECDSRIPASAKWCPACGAAIPAKPADAEPAAGHEPSVVDLPLGEQAPMRGGRWRRWSPVRWDVAHRATAVLVALIALTLAAGIVVLVKASDSSLASKTLPGSSVRLETSPVVRQEILERASKGTVAILTYHAATLDADQKAARAYMTPQMLAKYDAQFGAAQRKVVAELQETVETQVYAAAVESMTSNQATVLLMVVSATKDKGKQPQAAPGHHRVTLKKIDGVWLVDDIKRLDTGD